MSLTPEQINFDKTMRSAILTRFPLLGVSLSDAKIIPDDRVGTACTTGKNIYYSPTFFNSLSFEEQEFTIEHELLHRKFNHIVRAKDKDIGTWNLATDAVVNQILKEAGHTIPEGMIDMPEALNKSADEIYDKIIEEVKANSRQNNQNENNNSSNNSRERKLPNWLKKILEKLPKQPNNKNSSSNSTTKPNENGQKSNQLPTDVNHPDIDLPPEENNIRQEPRTGQGNNHNNEPDKLPDNFTPPTPPSLSPSMQNNIANKQHSSWQQNIPKMEQLQKKERIKDMLRKDKQSDITEENFQQKNEDKKSEELAKIGKKLDNKNSKKSLAEKIKELIDEKTQSNRLKNCENLQQFVEESEVEDTYAPIVDWKQYLNKPKTIKQEQTKTYMWSRRRATADSSWGSRLERYKEIREKEVEEDKPITLVSIDTSPSISESLLRGFINQLAPLTKESRVFVSFFWSHSTPFKEIIPDKDGKIHISVDRGYGTNLDSAVRKFKNVEIFDKKTKDWKTNSDQILNRIVFTDGDGQEFPDYDLSDIDCLWLVFDYPHGTFRPRCGKALQFSSRDLMRDIRHEERERIKHLTNPQDEKNFLR